MSITSIIGASSGTDSPTINWLNLLAAGGHKRRWFEQRGRGRICRRGLKRSTRCCWPTTPWVSRSMLPTR